MQAISGGSYKVRVQELAKDLGVLAADIKLAANHLGISDDVVDGDGNPIVGYLDSLTKLTPLSVECIRAAVDKADLPFSTSVFLRRLDMRVSRLERSIGGGHE